MSQLYTHFIDKLLNIFIRRGSNVIEAKHILLEKEGQDSITCYDIPGNLANYQDTPIEISKNNIVYHVGGRRLDFVIEEITERRWIYCDVSKKKVDQLIARLKAVDERTKAAGPRKSKLAIANPLDACYNRQT